VHLVLPNHVFRKEVDSPFTVHDVDVPVSLDSVKLGWEIDVDNLRSSGDEECFGFVPGRKELGGRTITSVPLVRLDVRKGAFRQRLGNRWRRHVIRELEDLAEELQVGDGSGVETESVERDRVDLESFARDGAPATTSQRECQCAMRVSVCECQCVSVGVKQAGKASHVGFMANIPL
jgi:hypothetical protein